MPIHINILENEVLGPPYLKGLNEGRQEGEITVLRRQLEKRFGPLPASFTNRLAALSTNELEELSERVLDAVTLEELFG